MVREEVQNMFLKRGEGQGKERRGGGVVKPNSGKGKKGGITKEGQGKRTTIGEGGETSISGSST